ncbi:MAG TPA: zinc-binding dehydrogenase [Jatrophihabitans sp.]|jgi:threonine dehydrogenase-like Zn-dependent dehydrogenase|nr:zinc-binding dehydrogenase [Jatrophihabitans sp.]
MKAISCKDAKLELIDLPTPTPGRGQLLIDVLRCGICGSDLHARHHCDELADITAEVGYDALMRSDQEVILGHEFCGEIVEHGPGCRQFAPVGTRVVALPLLRRGKEVHTTGLSAAAPGGFAEQMLVEESLAFAVPDGLSTELATLTEPMAVGLHAVRRSEIGKRTVAVVIGCGPVGLAVVCMLKARGVRTVIASDLSPGRRALAEACGADVVVDPAVESPFASSARYGHVVSAPAVFDLAVGTMEKLRRLPVPWWRIWQAAEAVGAATPKHPVVFECVGVPGVIDQLIADAPLYARLVVVGVCMQPDRLRPAMAINKEIDLRFVIGYTPRDYYDALHLLAEGKVNAAPVVTGVVGLPGVENAFSALSDPEAHAKILIDPMSDMADVG